MTPSNSPSDAAERRSPGRRGAATIPLHQRLLLGVLGIIAAGGGTMLVLRVDSPELGGTTLFVAAALLLSLSVIGRLPKMLEIAGVPLEFEKDEMSEFLRTLRAAVDADTVQELESQLRSMSADAKLFKEAVKQVDAEPEASPSSPETRPRAVTKREDPSWLSALKESAHDPTVEHEARVSGGQGSGRGQPPRVDHLVRFGDETAVVIEEMSAWNPSTLTVLARRLNRVAANHSSVQKLIVIMPEDGLEAAVKWRDEQWGNGGKVEVLADGSDEAAAVRAWTDALPVRQTGGVQD